MYQSWACNTIFRFAPLDISPPRFFVPTTAPQIRTTVLYSICLFLSVSPSGGLVLNQRKMWLNHVLHVLIVILATSLLATPLLMSLFYIRCTGHPVLIVTFILATPLSGSLFSGHAVLIVTIFSTTPLFLNLSTGHHGLCFLETSATCHTLIFFVSCHVIFLSMANEH